MCGWYKDTTCNLKYNWTWGACCRIRRIVLPLSLVYDFLLQILPGLSDIVNRNKEYCTTDANTTHYNIMQLINFWRYYSRYGSCLKSFTTEQAFQIVFVFNRIVVAFYYTCRSHKIYGKTWIAFNNVIVAWILARATNNPYPTHTRNATRTPYSVYLLISVLIN